MQAYLGTVLNRSSWVFLNFLNVLSHFVIHAGSLLLLLCGYYYIITGVAEVSRSAGLCHVYPETA